MIKRLNLVVAEDLKGELSVVYLGRDKAEATVEFEKLQADAKVRELVQIRDRKVIRTRRPAAAVKSAQEAELEERERIEREQAEELEALEEEAKEAAARAKEAKAAAAEKKKAQGAK